MRRIFLTAFSAIALIGPTSASSEEAVSHDEWCDTIAILSESVMSARQNGVPMRDVLRLARSKGEDDRIAIIARGMVEQAYGLPLYHTESNKRTSITEFQNGWYLECLQSKKE